MFGFLHNYDPSPILISIGPFDIHWYGVFIVSGLLLATLVILKLAPRYQLAKERLIDIIFWLVISGLAGARIYHVLLEYDYYLSHPADIIKFWQGGLALHGGLAAGLAGLYFLSRRAGYDPWRVGAVIAPGLALGQAVGRWGNYFNQEIFGAPTDLPWGIPIAVSNRPADFMIFTHFHPVFLYESIGNGLLFLLLWRLARRPDAGRRENVRRSVLFYLSGYSLLRFALEFLRLDPSLTISFLRWAQLVSLAVLIFCLVYYILKVRPKPKGPSSATLAKNNSI